MEYVDIGGLQLPAQGLGCMSMSGGYGPADWQRSVETIHLAVDLGVTLLDTANVYGYGHNEVLVGRAISGIRERVQIATKMGIDRSSGRSRPRYRGEPAYVRQAIDESLIRLGVEYVDIYYHHRPSPEVPVEETVGAMAELVAAGKVRHLALSNAGAELVRRAHAVHRIVAVESEYSLWERGAEELMPTLAELGIAFVPYSPLGRGLFTGTLGSAFVPGDKRRSHPRFTGAAAAANQQIVDIVEGVARRVGARPGQVALAWIYARGRRAGVPTIPVPGTKNPLRVVENAAALEVRLGAEDVAALDAVDDLVRAAAKPVRNDPAQVSG